MPGAPAFHRRSRREGAWLAPERQAVSALVRGAASIGPSHRSRAIPGSGKAVSGNCGKCGNPYLQCRRPCCWQAKRVRGESPGSKITFVGRVAPTYLKGGGKSGCGNCANPCLQCRRPCCCWQAKRFRREAPGNRITFVGRLAPTYSRGGGKSGCGNCANPVWNLAAVHLEGGDEGRLRDLDVADLAHPLLALLLLLEKLLLAADVAAVALGQHVLAQRADRLAGDDAPADRGLDGDLEELARDQVFQPLAQRPAAALGLVLVHDDAERIDRLAIHQDGELHQLALLVAHHLVVEAG